MSNFAIQHLSPDQTILFLGAGASMPSGGMSGARISRELIKHFSLTSSDGLSLMDTCSYVEGINGRKSLTEFIVAKLAGLRPGSGMLALPSLEWKEIYTTNFDTLVEQAYESARRPLSVVRSDFDYDSDGANIDTPLYKIHGCISQDKGYGHKSSMTLTHEDYDNYEQYRNILFNRLELSLSSNDVLIMGHSLSDPHLQDSIKKISKIKRGIKSNKNIYVVVYENDPIRTSLLQSMGCICSTSSFDKTIESLIANSQQAINFSTSTSIIPHQLMPTIIMVGELSNSITPTNANNLYNGKPADYEDIASGHTFERDIENQILAELASEEKRFCVVSGTNGVGKTTLCRRLCYRISSGINGLHQAWEQSPDLPLLVDQWVLVDKELRSRNENGVLFIDGIQEFGVELRQLSKLLPNDEHQTGLKILGAADHISWGYVTKTRRLFEQGFTLRLSRLTTSDVSRLVDLIESNLSISKLVDDPFKLMSKPKRIETLLTRCSRDMYVCLKNIFSNDGLDAIVLKEYDELSEDSQEIYRYVSALEASGCLVHRQMILRILDLPAQQVGYILDMLDGVIFEYRVNSAKQQGIYRWASRHHEISKTIAKYKFADQEQLFEMLGIVIDSINPSILIELKTIRLLCSSKFGIRTLRDKKKQITLYEKLIETAPNERVPWHRYISTLLDNRRLNDANQVINRAEKLFPRDAGIKRKSILLQIYKAQLLDELTMEDRKALLIHAAEDARKLVMESAENKFNYSMLLDAEFALAEMTNDYQQIDLALALTYKAYEALLDPWLEQCYHRYDHRRVHLAGYA